MSDKREWEQKICELLSATSFGIYPEAVKSYDKEKCYKERDGWKNGWNAAVMEYGSKIRGILHGEKRPWSSTDKLFAAAGDDTFMLNEDGSWYVFLNDTWYWGCADGEDIPKEEEKEVAELFREYGRAGVFWWVAKKRGHVSEFAAEQAMIKAVNDVESVKEICRKTDSPYLPLSFWQKILRKITRK